MSDSPEKTGAGFTPRPCMERVCFFTHPSAICWLQHPMALLDPNHHSAYKVDTLVSEEFNLYKVRSKRYTCCLSDKFISLNSKVCVLNIKPGKSVI